MSKHTDIKGNLKTVAKIFGLSENIIRLVLSNPADRISFSKLKPSKKEFEFFANLMIRDKLIKNFHYDEHVDENYI